MNGNSLNEPSTIDTLLPLLGVFDESLFQWILHQQNSLHRILLSNIQTPWGLILHLSELLEACIPYLETEFEEILPSVWVAKGVRIHGTAALLGPLVLGKGTEIDQEVCLHGPVYLGEAVRLERGVKIQSSILCEGVKVGVQSTVLDSILGKDVILGDNVTILTRGKDPNPLHVEYPLGMFHPTGCHRLGSFLCPGVRVRRGRQLEAGAFIPPGSLV